MHHPCSLVPPLTVMSSFPLAREVGTASDVDVPPVWYKVYHEYKYGMDMCCSVRTWLQCRQLLLLLFSSMNWLFEGLMMLKNHEIWQKIQGLMRSKAAQPLKLLLVITWIFYDASFCTCTCIFCTCTRLSTLYLNIPFLLLWLVNLSVLGNNKGLSYLITPGLNIFCFYDFCWCVLSSLPFSPPPLSVCQYVFVLDRRHGC